MTRCSIDPRQGPGALDHAYVYCVPGQPSLLVRVPRGQQFGLRSRASGRLHGTPCLSRISETPKDFDHTIVSTFGRTAAPPVRPLFLQPRLSLLPHRRRRPPKTLLCVILSWNPQCLVHCTLACPLRPPTTASSHCQAAQIYLVDEIRLTQHMLLTHALTHYSSALTHAESTFSFSTRSRYPRNSATPRFPRRPRG